MRTKYLLIGCFVLAVAGAGIFLSKPQTHSQAVAKQIPEVKGASTRVVPRPHPTKQDFAPLPFATSTGMHVPILMYHHIGYVPTGTVDSIRIGLTVSPQDFAAQVNYLKQNGYTSITLNDLYLATQNKFILPKKPVIFTFDDGYADAFTNGIPILQKYGYTGLFGIITQFPGTVSGTNTYATWDQIAAAKSEGMEIICHTENHFDGSNPKFDSSYIYQNLSGCQQALQSHLGTAEPFIMYPYGHYTADYLAQAKALGFVMGISVHESSWVNPHDLMELPRVRVEPNEPMDIFIEKLNN